MEDIYSRHRKLNTACKYKGRKKTVTSLRTVIQGGVSENIYVYVKTSFVLEIYQKGKFILGETI